MTCVKFIGMDNKKYALCCSDYKVVKNADDDKRLYYIQNGNRCMVRFSAISMIIEDYTPEIEYQLREEIIKAYVIMVENMKTNTRKASQEAYKTLQQAHAFCMGRSDYVVKHNDYLFYDGIYRYEIVEIKII